MTEKIRYVDLFAGCGGLSYGFQYNKKFLHVAASDIWSQAKATYEKNFPNSNYILADLSKGEDLKGLVEKIGNDIDLVIGGPPCKGFSTLNNRKTKSKYNTLVDQYLTVISNVLPKIFLIENVRGFTSKKHPSGITYPQHLKNRIQKFNSGYNYLEVLLNARDYGLAQNRIRYFFIATNKEFDPSSSKLRQIRSLLERNKTNEKKVLKDVILDLPKVPVRGGKNSMALKNGSFIYNHKSMNHSHKLEERLQYVPVGGGLLDVPVSLLTNHLLKMVEGKYGTGGFAKNIYGRMSWNEPSGTIVAGMDKITVGRFVHPDQNRLLTPRECARIQSFPDNFVFEGGQVSQYYQIGNAVPPKLSELFSNIFCDVIVNSKDQTENEILWN